MVGRKQPPESRLRDDDVRCEVQNRSIGTHTMATATLGASARTESGKGAARKLRATGNVPGVIYGHGRDPLALSINAREFERLAEKVRITSTVIELAVDGKTAKTLIREIQRHPLDRALLH